MTRWADVALLLVLAWTVAVPLSAAFARARWTAREPLAALLAWQAVGLCGGLAVLTAELTLAVSGRGGSWPGAVREVLSHPGTVDAVGALGLALLAVSACWLLAVLVTSFAAAARSRREHRLLLELLCRPDGGPAGPFQLIDSPAPVAYAVPGRTSHVVLSTAARTRLDDRQLAAVLAHERAHLRQRHSVLVQPFVAWQRSLPMLTAPGAARRRVEQLVELVCDDAAVRASGVEATRAALGTLLGPAGGLDAAGAERVDRLDGRPDPVLRAALVAAAVLLVVLPPALLALLG